MVTWATFSLASGASRADTVRVVAPLDGTCGTRGWRQLRRERSRRHQRHHQRHDHGGRHGGPLRDEDPGLAGESRWPATRWSTSSPRPTPVPRRPATWRLADSLPGGVTFVDATNAGSEASGVVTWADVQPEPAVPAGRTRCGWWPRWTARCATPSWRAAQPVIPRRRTTRTSVTTSVAKSADLSVSKTLASPASPVAGDTLVYVITTSNAGPSDRDGRGAGGHAAQRRDLRGRHELVAPKPAGW